MSPEHTISKSDYLQYLMCPEELWLLKNKPELMPPITNDDLHTIEQGNIIDNLAQRLFQDEQFLSRLKINPEDVSFQKSLEIDGLIARCDILVKNGGNYHLYEVKAATGVKPEHIHDTAFQKLVFEKSGYPIERTFLVHVNKEYRAEDSLKLLDFLSIDETSEEVNAEKAVTEERTAQALTFINGPKPPKRINHNCAKKKECPFFTYQFPDFPDYSVFDIARINFTFR